MTERHDDSSSWGRQWEIFHAALELPAAAREEFLAQECTDGELRQEVEELLASHEGATGLLDKSLEIPSVDRMDDDSSEQATLLQESAKTLSPGTLLAGRFEIVQLLGQGGMGSVFEAQDRALETRVAIKMLRAEVSRFASARERFRREIQLARQVTHPNVCRIFDLFEDSDGWSFLSMELLDGESLAERLERGGAVEPDDALPIVKQIAAALGAAHRVGVVHRDLKSANVMLVPEGDDIRAVVTDFGLATTARPGEESLLHLTRTGQLLGTPAFMAPEQLEGGEITAATDIYAFGIVMFEMLTGRLPFEGSTPYSIAARRLNEEAPSPRHHLPDLELPWERTILRCLERRPEDRFATVEEILSSLEGDSVSLPRSLARRRYRKIAWATVALLLVVAALLVLPRLWRLEPTSRSAETTVTEAAPSAAQERVWVLIWAFDNRTGEKVFDVTVEAALARELSNSRFLSVVPQQRIEDGLRLMKRPPDTRVGAVLAREIALRDGDIQALVAGQVEKLGATYVLSADISAPGGLALASVTQEIGDQEEIAAGIRQLSSQVRENLGQLATEISRSESQLPKVTTPSLRALQLYSEADAAMKAKNDPVAEGLLRQAVAEDPDFASGQIQLAYTIRNQDRPQEEYLPYAQQAVELVETITDPERFFVLGGFHAMLGESEKAIQNFEALLRLDPVHFWALRNLADVRWDRGQGDQMIPYWVKAAELQPNDFTTNGEAGWILWAIGGRLDEAEPYVQRALERATVEEQRRSPDLMTWLWLFPVHQAWMQGDPEAALVELERLGHKATETTGELHTELAWRVGLNYAYLGQLEAAERMYLNMAASKLEEGQWHRRVMRGLEMHKVDRDQWREVLDGNIIPSLGAHEVRNLVLAGMLVEARELWKMLEEPSTLEVRARAIHRSAEGELALAQGNFAKAIPLLEEAIAGQRHFALGHSFFIASESLARAFEFKGRTETAFAVLEDASQQRPRAIFGKGGWMDMRLYMAELHRQHGREVEARAIEDELRSLLQYADSDFRFVRQLERLEQSYPP